MASETSSCETSPCLTCGACCAYSAEWPRFTTEDDAALDRIPADFVKADLSGMRCVGDRCAALVGVVGSTTACSLYDVRPDVCRSCTIGDHACLTARAAYGLPVIAGPADAAEDADLHRSSD